MFTIWETEIVYFTFGFALITVELVINFEIEARTQGCLLYFKFDLIEGLNISLRTLFY